MIPPSRMIPPQPNPRPNPPPTIAVLATAVLEIGEPATGERAIAVLAIAVLAIAVLATVGPVIANTGYFSATFAWVRQSGLVFP